MVSLSRIKKVPRGFPKDSSCLSASFRPSFPKYHLNKHAETKVFKLELFFKDLKHLSLHKDHLWRAFKFFLCLQHTYTQIYPRRKRLISDNDVLAEGANTNNMILETRWTHKKLATVVRLICKLIGIPSERPIDNWSCNPKSAIQCKTLHSTIQCKEVFLISYRQHCGARSSCLFKYYF